MDKYYGLIALVIYIACLIAYIRYEAKHEVNDENEDQEEVKTVAPKTVGSPLDINDEDAVVASLIAAIECRNEYKKNVQIVSIRKVN